MICITLNDLYYVEWFELRWKIYTMLNDLCSVEWFVQRWMICTTMNNFYYAEWFVQRWMICTTLNHLDYHELLGIGFLMSARCAYSRKYCNMFYTNLWVDFSRFGNIKKKYIKPCLEIGHKEVFLITLMETIINAFSRHI